MRILTAGYWNNNLGDDLFLKILSERYPNHDFYIIAGYKAYDTFASIRNIHQIQVPLFIKLLNHFHKQLNINSTELLGNFQLKTSEKFDAYCEIGGSLFMLPNNGMGEQFEVRKKMLENTNLPYFIIGSNFGPFSHQYQLKEYSKLFNQMSSITFRDRYSTNLFSALKNVSYAPDIAFNLDTNGYKSNENYTLISVINPETRFNSKESFQYYCLIQKIVENLRDRGEKIILMSFCDGEGDREAALNIKNNVGGKNISIYSHHKIEDSLRIISNAKQVVATRYHAMILSWLFGKPTFVLSYSDKINRVVQDIFPGQPLINIKNNLNDGEDLTLVFKIAPDLSKVRRKASRQFEALDNLLQ